MYKCKLLFIFLVFIFTTHQSVAQYRYGHDAAARAAYLDWLRYQKAKEEGSNLKKWWKGESTLGLAFTGPLQYSHRSKYDSVEHVSQRSYDSVIKGTAKPELSFHMNGNTNHMLARISDNSILSFSAGAEVNILRWKLETYNGNTLQRKTGSLLHAQFGAPLTLDYKWGCDVDFDRELKTCFAVGGGMMPLVGINLMSTESMSLSAKMAPYLYASFGFYAWGCWKIRASYMPGNYTVVKDATANYGGTTNTLNMQGGNNFMIGISHMSRSIDWGRGSGWRNGVKFGGGGGRRRHVYENSRMF